MLKLSMTPGEYITVGDNVVIQLYRVEGKRSYIAIDAPKEVTVLRGAVSEREGAAPPKHLARVPGKG